LRPFLGVLVAPAIPHTRALKIEYETRGHTHIPLLLIEKKFSHLQIISFHAPG